MLPGMKTLSGYVLLVCALSCSHPQTRVVGAPPPAPPPVPASSPAPPPAPPVQAVTAPPEPLPSEWAAEPAPTQGWLKTFGTESSRDPATFVTDRATAVALGPTGVLFVGAMESMRPGGRVGCPLLAFSASGERLKSFTQCPAFAEISELRGLPDGGALVAGFFFRTLKLGGTTYSSRGERDIFLARVSSTGAVKWSRQFGGPNDDVIRGMFLGDANSVVLVTTSWEMLGNIRRGKSLESQLHRIDLDGKNARSVDLIFGADLTDAAMDAQGRIGLLFSEGPAEKRTAQLVVALQDGSLQETLMLDVPGSKLAPASEGWLVVSSPGKGERKDILVTRVRSRTIEWTRALPWTEPGDDSETIVDMGGVAVLPEKLAVVTLVYGPLRDSRMVIHTLTPDGVPEKRYVVLRTKSLGVNALAATPSGGLYIVGMLSGAAAFGSSIVDTLSPVYRNFEGFILFIEKP